MTRKISSKFQLNPPFLNFRDISEIPNYYSSHLKLKPKLIFRSGALSRYKPQILKDFLDKNKIRYIIDLRPNWERINTEGDLFRIYDKEVIKKYVVRIILDPKKVGKYIFGRPYGNLYFGILKDYHLEIKEIFSKFILNARENRIIIHCEAGKDRTGILIALLYDLLGIDREIIIKDYLFSAFDTKREYIEYIIKVIDEEYQGSEAFLLHHCKISQETLEKIKNQLLFT